MIKFSAATAKHYMVLVLASYDSVLTFAEDKVLTESLYCKMKKLRTDAIWAALKHHPTFAGCFPADKIPHMRSFQRRMSEPLSCPKPKSNRRPPHSMVAHLNS